MLCIWYKDQSLPTNAQEVNDKRDGRFIPRNPNEPRSVAVPQGRKQPKDVLCGGVRMGNVTDGLDSTSVFNSLPAYEFVTDSRDQ